MPCVIIEDIFHNVIILYFSKRSYPEQLSVVTVYIFHTGPPWESNPLPRCCKCHALSTELRGTTVSLNETSCLAGTSLHQACLEHLAIGSHQNHSKYSHCSCTWGERLLAWRIQTWHRSEFKSLYGLKEDGTLTGMGIIHLSPLL